MRAPVAVFAYNRADKLKECLRSLNDCDGAQTADLYIFSDGPKGAEDIHGVSEVRGLLDDFSEKNNFKSVSVKKNDQNRGLADSVISGVSEVIDAHGEVIVVEDDLTVTGDFLRYMNDVLDFYRDEERVWSVTGYSEPLRALKHYKHDVFFGYRGCSYGWGTWKDRWDTVDWNVGRYSELLESRRLQRQFNRGGNDMVRMLKDQRSGLIDSWAIRWCFAQSLQNRYTVYPAKTLVINNGRDGSGTNQGRADRVEYRLHDPKDSIKLEVLEPDLRISRSFYHYHSDTIKRIKRNLNIKGICRQLKRISGSLRHESIH